MLPTHKTPRKQQLSDLTVLIHGPQKYGKSEFCSQAEGALFLATEAGLNSLEVFQVPISNWEDLLHASKEIADGKHAFRTVVIDTADNAYRMCAEYICQRKQVEHESDLEYGKGYALVNHEFFRVLNKLALLPYGLFLVSHSHEKEFETRTGKYTKIVPTLPEKASKLVLGLVDVILFCDFEVASGPDGKPVHRRVLRTKPSTAYEAGDRTGRLPDAIDCSFAAFAAAFQLPAQVGGAAPGPDLPASAAPEPIGAVAAPAPSPPKTSVAPLPSKSGSTASPAAATTTSPTAAALAAPTPTAARSRTSTAPSRDPRSTP
jgi:hypothetical protein